MDLPQNNKNQSHKPSDHVGSVKTGFACLTVTIHSYLFSCLASYAHYNKLYKGSQPLFYFFVILMIVFF